MTLVTEEDKWYKKKIMIAAAHLMKAQTILDITKTKLKKNKQWWYVNDVAHFLEQVSEILSTDNGEAGLHHYINTVLKDA